MASIVDIGESKITIKEHNGQRVVTFRDIDAAHVRSDGTARKRFNDNKRHFIQGVDYFVRNSDEARLEFGRSAPNGLTLITESGYLMLVKSFTDDLAWSVQRELVNNYFRQDKQSPAPPPKEAVTISGQRLRAAYMKEGIDEVREYATTLKMLTGRLSHELRAEYYWSLLSVISSTAENMKWRLDRLGKSSEQALGRRDAV